jgi:hypothetical protein
VRRSAPRSRRQWQSGSGPALSVESAPISGFSGCSAKVGLPERSPLPMAAPAPRHRPCRHRRGPRRGHAPVPGGQGTQAQGDRGETPRAVGPSRATTTTASHASTTGTRPPSGRLPRDGAGALDSPEGVDSVAGLLALRAQGPAAAAQHPVASALARLQEQGTPMLARRLVYLCHDSASHIVVACAQVVPARPAPGRAGPGSEEQIYRRIDGTEALCARRICIVYRDRAAQGYSPEYATRWSSTGASLCTRPTSTNSERAASASLATRRSATGR